MVLQRAQAPPPPRPWEDAPEIEYRLYKNPVKMGRSFNSVIVSIKRLVLRESANEAEGTKFVTGEDSDDTAPKNLHIHKIPQLPQDKTKYFIIVMYPPDDLDMDDTPMVDNKEVKFLFSLYNLYLIGISYDEKNWHVFDDAMIEGITKAAKDIYVQALGFSGAYGTIGQNYLKLNIGFNGQCDTYNKVAGMRSNKTSDGQLSRVLCQTVVTLPESARFPFLAQFQLGIFYTGNLDAVLDMLVVPGEEFKNFSLHLTKWGTYSTMGKQGRKCFNSSKLQTTGIKSFSGLLNFIAIATNKKYDEENNLLNNGPEKRQSTGDADTDKKGDKEGHDKDKDDSQKNKKDQDLNDEKNWFYQAPVVSYVPQGRQKLRVKVDKLGNDSLINSVKPSMSWKLIHTYSAFIANKRINNILKARGKSAKECFLLNGYSLNSRHTARGMPTRVTPARIACLDQKIRQRESIVTKEQIEKVFGAPANAVFATKRFDEMPLNVAAGAYMEGVETFDPSFFGHADEVVEGRISDDEMVLVADSGGALEAALLSLYLENQVRRTLGSREQLAIDEATCSQVADSGGALEAALSVYLENQARRTLGSREQLAIAEFAESSPKKARKEERTMEGPSECVSSILGANLIIDEATCSQVADSGGALEAALLSLYLENQARRTLGSREQLAIAEFAKSSPKKARKQELTVEGPSETVGMAKATLVKCASSNLGANIAVEDTTCSWNWYAGRAQEDSRHHDHYPRLAAVA